MATWHLTVEGHDWVVHDRPDQPGAYDFQWLTGPDGYGFSMGSSDGSPMGADAMSRNIASFLSQVNPATGYLD